jgi:hypothetical protein
VIAVEWTIKIVVPEHKTYDGITVERQEKEVTIPFSCYEAVYYVHRKKWWKSNSLYVITKCRVTGAWATNMVGVILDNDNHVGEDEFDRIFTDKEAAIEYCIKKNEFRKVKIYGE